MGENTSDVLAETGCAIVCPCHKLAACELQNKFILQTSVGECPLTGDGGNILEDILEHVKQIFALETFGKNPFSSFKNT